MNLLNSLLGKQVVAVVAGVAQPLEGTLVDTGTDVIVISSGVKFLYIPIAHVKSLINNLEAIVEQNDIPVSLPTSQETTISLQTLVENSQGSFTEIHVAGAHALHGYIQRVLADYLLFYSPIFDTILVHMKHLKYLVPYPPQFVPYSLKQDKLNSDLSAVSTEPNFIQQLEKMEGSSIVIDLAAPFQKAGLLKKVQAPTFELVTPTGESIFAPLDHIQTVNYPRK
ncbi:hypothetical protein [Paenibacillus sp. GCM10012306]|uniref:hypothetical protein n=1 Tax=Paenibacillus sp. GCM10012306 TaxID=3317342 RepID=UPI0036125F57